MSFAEKYVLQIFTKIKPQILCTYFCFGQVEIFSGK